MERIATHDEEEEDIFYSPESTITTTEEEDIERNDQSIITHSHDHGSDVEDEEKKKIVRMRTILQNQNPACKEIDDLTLRRFLRARDLDVGKASTMFMKYITWRQTFVPKGSISDSEVRNHIAHNKLFMQGKDKKGRPISVVFGAKHFPCKGGLDEFMRFVVFGLDILCSRIPDGEEKFSSIIDLQGYGYYNIDIRGYKAGLSIFQDYYPERLGKVFLIHVPYIFMTAWKIIYPFIDKNTREKIVFVQDKTLKATLMEDIDESQLPKIYGGKLELEHVSNV